MRILLLTNKNTDNQSDVINALGKNMNIFVNHGPIGLDYIKKNKIAAILSDRNGFLIPEPIINCVNGQVFNTHPSILPFHRGWQPIFFSVLEQTDIGVSIHLVNSELDKGKLLCQSKVEESPHETLKSIHTKCRNKIIEILKTNWEQILDQKISPVRQEGKGCYHNSKEFNEYFAKLPMRWDSTLDEVRKLIL